MTRRPRNRWDTPQGVPASSAVQPRRLSIPSRMHLDPTSSVRRRTYLSYRSFPEDSADPQLLNYKTFNACWVKTTKLKKLVIMTESRMWYNDIDRKIVWTLLQTKWKAILWVEKEDMFRNYYYTYQFSFDMFVCYGWTKTIKFSKMFKKLPFFLKLSCLFLLLCFLCFRRPLQHDFFVAYDWTTVDVT